MPEQSHLGWKRLFRLLQDHLPNNFNAWYEPQIDDRHTDFTILSHTFGLLILEVKGWYPAQLSRVNDQNLELLITHEGQSQLERHKNPYRQVREYMFSAMDLLGKEPLLRNDQGPYQGRLCFPCGSGEVFTNMTRAQSVHRGRTSDCRRCSRFR